MLWKRAIVVVAMLFALVALALWQWDEYGHECDLARDSVSSSAESVMNALVGGARSHRRLGPFFTESMQGVLDGLVQAKDVRVAAIVPDERKSALTSGETSALDLATPLTEGGFWEIDGYRLVRSFQLPLDSPGRGGGAGQGRGWGRRWQDEPEAAGPFGPGRSVAAVLVLDGARANEICRHAAWLRGSIVAGGWLVVGCVAVAWWASVRLAEARGRARMLETEARHFRDLSQAAAGLAHETRNPLGLIRGWTQRLAESGVGSSTGAREAHSLIEECDRVTARINQFLAFARPSEPRWEMVDLAALLDELRMLLEPDLAAKQVTLSHGTQGTMLRADREMLRQALFNLLQNAIQASPTGERVEVFADRDRHGKARIAVADRGAGVPPEAVGRLFTPYFTTRSAGTGLGLAIVRRIAAAHGWDVGYTPRPDGGALFWMDGIDG